MEETILSGYLKMRHHNSSNPDHSARYSLSSDNSLFLHQPLQSLSPRVRLNLLKLWSIVAYWQLFVASSRVAKPHKLFTFVIDNQTKILNTHLHWVNKIIVKRYPIFDFLYIQRVYVTAKRCRVQLVRSHNMRWRYTYIYIWIHTPSFSPENIHSLWQQYAECKKRCHSCGNRMWHLNKLDATR